MCVFGRLLNNVPNNCDLRRKFVKMCDKRRRTMEMASKGVSENEMPSIQWQWGCEAKRVTDY